MDRRTCLGLLLAAGAVGLGGDGAWPVVTPAGPPRGAGSFLNICAHPDDDLYFLNPDVVQALDTGCPVTSVYLTAGEADGINAAQGPGHEDHPVDFEAYAAARQQGIRAAYALMATGDRDSPWRRTLRTLAGLPVEVATLAAAPHVNLIDLNIRAPLGAHGPAGNRLEWLWTGQRARQDFLRPAGSLLPGAGRLDREQLLGVLAELLDRLRPSVVRTLDPAPEHLRSDGDTITYSDHDDHRHAAWFAWEAARRHARTTPVQVQSYRGYFNKYWPRNLSRGVYHRKFTFLDVYGWADAHPCGQPYGCGDLQVGAVSRSKRYGRSQTYRYPGTTTWLAQDTGGLAAFAVLGGRALRWTGGYDGWDAPTDLGGDGLVPHLDVVSGSDGSLHLLGLRQLIEARRERHVVVHAAQAWPGGPFTGWEELGNPDGEGVRGREIGLPTAVFGADGLLTVFARDFRRGVSLRAQRPGGGWGPWTALPGDGLRDTLVAAAAGERTELYAVTAHDLLRWRRDRPSGPFGAPERVLSATLDGSLSLLRTPDGTEPQVLVGHADGAAFGLVQGRSVRTLRAGGGTGPLAGVLCDGVTHLLRRNDSGGVSLSFPLRGGRPRWWPTGGLFTGAPAAAVDASGRPVAATVGVDGRLWTCRLGGSPQAVRWQPANDLAPAPASTL